MQATTRRSTRQRLVYPWQIVAIGFILTGANTGTAFCPGAARVKSVWKPATSVETTSFVCQSHSVFDQQRQQIPPSSNSIRPLGHPIYSSTSPSADQINSDGTSSSQSPLTALRSTLRAATGFSLTAFRATLRAATGISLSQTISGALRSILGILHPGLRYFLQPLLIMYYAPLLMIRYWMVGPSQQYVEESQKDHEKLVEGWRKAVEAAEKANAGGYWPVHLNDDGTITTSLPPDPSIVLDLADGIEKSVAATTTSEATSA